MQTDGITIVQTESIAIIQTGSIANAAEVRNLSEDA